MKTNRRDFLRGIVMTGFSSQAMSAVTYPKKNEVVKLTVLHTNDTHSHFEPFPEDHPKYPGRGGVKKRATIIKKIREENNHVLLLDAGDIFQGTPYFNIYNGLLEFKAMSLMGYDAVTMGNHDFDIGLDGFLKAYPEAKFPFVCSNYDFSNTQLNGKTNEYRIIRKGMLKIGVIGLGIELEGLVSKDLYGDTRYIDPLEKAQNLAIYLKEEMGCHLVVILSHLGYNYKTNKISDQVLAKETSHIDLIVGGHTHTFLDRPEVIENKIGNKVLVNQVGWAGINLGRIDFTFYSGDNNNLSLVPFYEKNQIINV